MDPSALILEVFGVGSLVVAFAKYTYEKRKANGEDDLRYHGLNEAL